ncbi:MAG: hypothetical protein ACYDHE_17065 [Candidatus Acidiferrales bacterium]
MTDEMDVAYLDRVHATMRPPDVENPPAKNEYQRPFHSTRQRFNVLAGPTFTECHMSAGFPIRSVRIDNASSQWLQMGSELDFIPPFTFGRIVNVRGVGAVDIVPGVPPGGIIAQGVLAVGDFLLVTLFDRPQMPSYGSNMSVAGIALVRQQ